MSLATSSPFAKARSKPSPSRNLTSKELEEIKYAFGLFDREKKGWVYPRELKVALRALDFPVRKAEVVSLLSRATGLEQVDQVDYETFESVIAQQLCSRQPIDKYKRAFRLLDVDQNGAIDFKALKAVVSHLQDMRIDDAELKEMIHEFDYDKDGAINEEEFLAIMQAYDE